MKKGKDMDGISELPQLIIHQIFSYLDTKEAARTSVLSKTWLEAWSTSPILVLDEPRSNNYDEDKRQNFFSFVGTTLLRYRTQNLRIDKLTIVQHRGNTFPHSLLDQSIEIALDHHVKELAINVSERSPYALPRTIFNTCAKFNLRHLELYGLFVSDTFLNQLVTKCPHLEFVKIRFCHKLERINVSGPLKHVFLQYCDNLVEANIIDVPNLLTLEYIGQKVLSLSLVDSNWEELRTRITINCDRNGRPWPDITWFHQLRKLLEETISRSSVNVLLRLRLNEIQFDSDLNRFANPLPLDMLAEMNQSSFSFLERLFSLCRPTIIVTSRSPCGPACIDFMMLLSSELKQGISSDCCSSNQGTKCWRHYLKNIKVEGCQDSEHAAPAWEPLPLETLQGSYIYDSRKLLKIRFEWI